MTNQPSLGSWTAFRHINDAERNLFDKEISKIEEAKYIPLSVSSQIVKGMRYRFLCEVAKPDVVPYNALVMIYFPLPCDGDPNIYEVKKLVIE